MFSKKIIVAVTLLSATACSPHQNLISERERSNPPQNAQDVGTILEGAKPEQVNAILAAHPEAKVRQLNSEHGMYEIFNVDDAQLHKEFDGTSSKNMFIPLRTQDKMDIYASTGPAGLQVGSLETCKDAATGPAPTAVMTAEAPSQNIVTVELGQTVKVNGLKSTAAANDEAPLKLAFAVLFPDEAPTQTGGQDGPTLEFKPDTLGLHKIYLVAQGANGVCSIDALRFIVTANRPYKGPAARALKADRSKFKHLGRVHAEEAWQIAKGDGVVIAVVDTGVNYNHPSLAPNIAVNQGEIPDNQIDDEKNGFIDDYAGYDFVNRDGYAYDDDSHGTHVAGLAASKQFGLAPNAQILPVKALTSLGGDVGTIAAAIRYAVDRKANIINLSLGAGGAIPQLALVNAANYAEQHGVLLVVAVGNGDPNTGLGYDIDKSPVWPASLKNENILTVASFDSENVLAPYSNFGKTSVDVVAPGGFKNDPMVSCAFENPRGALLLGLVGTSMAAPVVSGIVADMWSKAPGLSIQDVKQVLTAAGPVVPELQAITVSGRHLDALSAVQNAATKNLLF